MQVFDPHAVRAHLVASLRSPAGLRTHDLVACEPACYRLGRNLALYKGLLRPKLESCVEAGRPFLKGDIKNFDIFDLANTSFGLSRPRGSGC